MNADGSDVIRVTNGRDAAPAWSPDGTRIAFYREEGEVSAIFLVNADGSDLVRLVG
jgi:Tol biopolymer transport system component